jgi:hypothetical protein
VQLERSAFYTAAKAAYVVIATGETSAYANLILSKGVIPAAALTKPAAASSMPAAPASAPASK